jgi:predicted ester cyclase
MPSAVEHNRRLVHRLVEIVNERRLDEIEEVAAGQVARAAARWIGPFARAFPDFRMEVVDVVAEAGKVAGYFRCSGTQLGEWQGRPPSNRRFEAVDEVYVFEVRDGRLVRAIVAIEDNLTRMRQLGLLD